MTLLLALVVGALIGLSLGALGGGGTILAVPVLVYLFDQSPAPATTGSLVVVTLTSLVGAVTARRQGNVALGAGIIFAAVAVAGSAVGAIASSRVPGQALMLAFAVLMVVVAALMTLRLLRGRSSQTENEEPSARCRVSTRTGRQVDWCRWGKLLLSATVVGFLTGFLGVGGGFLVVPALAMVMRLPMRQAVGTSLVVITVNSAVALAVRSGVSSPPDWSIVATLTLGSAGCAALGAWLGDRVSGRALQTAFTILIVLVAIYTAIQALTTYA